MIQKTLPYFWGALFFVLLSPCCFSQAPPTNNGEANTPPTTNLQKEASSDDNLFNLETGIKTDEPSLFNPALNFSIECVPVGNPRNRADTSTLNESVEQTYG